MVSAIVMQVQGELVDVQASVVFDVLLDGKYRGTWDENMLEDYEICMLDGNNDIGYYSSECVLISQNWW